MTEYIQAFEGELGADVSRPYSVKPLRRLRTGLRSLDMLLRGGVPAGHITEVIGIDDVGKSTLLLHLLAEHNGVLIDCDGHYDPAYACRIGARPLLANTVEMRAVDTVVSEFLAAGELVILDSLAAVIPTDENRHPKPISDYLAVMVPMWRQLAANYGGTLVIIDQLRYRPGVGHRARSTGGQDIAARAALRLHLRPAKGDVEVSVIRDIHNPSQRSVSLDVEEEWGFSKSGAWLDGAVAIGEVLKSGSWYTWPTGEVIAQGRDEAKKVLDGMSYL